jgi:hypothetical protein
MAFSIIVPSNPFPPMKLPAKLGLILCSLTLVSCSSPSQITTSTDGKLYINKFFRLTVQKPSSWYAQDMEESTVMHKQGGKLMAGDDKKMQALADASKPIPLFSFFEVKPGTIGRLNPNVIGVAEKIPFFVKVKTGCDYLEKASKIASKSQVRIAFGKKCSSRTINGNTFNTMDAQISMNGVVIKQRYFVALRKNHAISMIQTFAEPEDEAKLDKVVSSVTLK